MTECGQDHQKLGQEKGGPPLPSWGVLGEMRGDVSSTALLSLSLSASLSVPPEVQAVSSGLTSTFPTTQLCFPLIGSTLD